MNVFGKAAMLGGRVLFRGGLLLVCAAGLARGANAAATSFDCVTEPSLSLKLGSSVSSILDSVNVDRGDTVKKGQIVAHLQSDVEQAVVAANKARGDSTAEIQAKQAVLTQKEAVLKRKLELQQQHVASVQDVDNAKAEYNVATQELALGMLNHRMAQIELTRSEAELALRTIRSPIDGVVTKRSLGPGEFVNQEATIVSIAQINPLNVETYLPVRYYKFIKIGEIAAVHPNDPFGGDRKAKVTVVDQVFDAASGTFGVRLELPNPDNEVPAGLRCRVAFDLPERSADDAESPKDRIP